MILCTILDNFSIKVSSFVFPGVSSAGPSVVSVVSGERVEFPESVSSMKGSTPDMKNDVVYSSVTSVGPPDISVGVKLPVGPSVGGGLVGPPVGGLGLELLHLQNFFFGWHLSGLYMGGGVGRMGRGGSISMGVSPIKMGSSPPIVMGSSPVGTVTGSSPVGTVIGSSPVGTVIGSSPVGVKLIGSSPLVVTEIGSSPFGVTVIGSSPFVVKLTGSSPIVTGSSLKRKGSTPVIGG